MALPTGSRRCPKLWPPLLVAFVATTFYEFAAAEGAVSPQAATSYAQGMELKAKGKHEDSIKPFWAAFQAGHPEGMERMREAYAALGREWGLWHELAKLHAGELMKEGGRKSNPSVSDEVVQERVHAFYKQAIDAGAPASVAAEYAQVKRRLVTSDQDALETLIEGITKTGGTDGGLWHELGSLFFNHKQWMQSMLAMEKARTLLPDMVQIRATVMYLRAKVVAWGPVPTEFSTPNEMALQSGRVTSWEDAERWPATWKRDLNNLVKAVTSDLDRGDAAVKKGGTPGPPTLHPLMSLFLPVIPPELRLRLARTQARMQVAEAKALTHGVRPMVFKHASVVRDWKAYKASLAKAGTRTRIKVGFVASRFHGSALALLLLGVMPALDRELLEVTMYSVKKCDDDCQTDKWRLVFVNGVEHWVDLGNVDAQTAVERVRKDKNHVLVDMDGYNNEGNRRTEIFALRSAPVQMHVQDYMGTTGASFIDWLWADDVVFPTHLAASDKHAQERLVYCPPSFFVSSHRELYEASGEKPTVVGAGKTLADTPKAELDARESFQLPLEGDGVHRPFVYACFNKMEKVAPETLLSWVRILLATRNVNGGSVLWLLLFPREAEQNVRSIAEALAHQELAREKKRKGAKSENVNEVANTLARKRIIFGEFYKTDAENMQRLGYADLLLDTQPYGAHTGAVDALWSGVPIVTRSDTEPMASRVALSLITGISEPSKVSFTGEHRNATKLDLVTELGASSSAMYEEIAIAHATDRERHGRVRATLESRRQTSRIFNATEHAKALGGAVVSIWDEYLQAGSKPVAKRPRFMYSYGKEAEERSARIFGTGKAKPKATSRGEL